MDFFNGLGSKFHGQGIQSAKFTMVFFSPPAATGRFVENDRVFQ